MRKIRLLEDGIRYRKSRRRKAAHSRERSTGFQLLITASLVVSLLLTGCGNLSASDTGGPEGQRDKQVEESLSFSTMSEIDRDRDMEPGKEAQDAMEKKAVRKGNREMKLKSLYIELLGTYLKEQLGLEDYDREIEDLGCLTKEGESRSEAQNERNMGLKYLYLRNDIHVERLSEDDLTVLEAGYGQTEGDAYDHAMEVVVRTFPFCITPVALEREEDKKFNYVYDNVVSSQNGETAVTMDTLLLRIATRAEYDDEGEYVDAYREVQKEKGLYDIAERMEAEMEGLLGDVPIIVQVDFIS